MLNRSRESEASPFATFTPRFQPPSSEKGTLVAPESAPRSVFSSHTVFESVVTLPAASYARSRTVYIPVSDPVAKTPRVAVPVT